MRAPRTSRHPGHFCISPPTVRREPESPAQQPGGKLFLFVDWYHVKKGDLKAVLDPRQVSEQGRLARARFAQEFNLSFEDGEHGFQRLDVPHGVSITPEPAERSKPWLVPDRPWEKMLAWTTVLRDEGRYRCWTQTILNGQKTVDGVKDSKFGSGRIALQYGAGVVKDKGVVKFRKVEIKPL